MAAAYAQLPEPVQALAIRYGLDEKLLWSPDILRNRALVAFFLSPFPYLVIKQANKLALDSLWNVAGQPALLKPGNFVPELVMSVIGGASFMVICGFCMKMGNNCARLTVLQSYGITPTVFTDPAIADFRRDCGKLWRVTKTLSRVTLGHALRDRRLLER